MDETQAPKRRGRPAKVAIDQGPVQSKSEIDPDEKPAIRALKKRIATTAQTKVVETYYEESLTDIRKVSITSSGNKYRTWVCNKSTKDQKMLAFIKELKAKGELRIY